MIVAFTGMRTHGARAGNIMKRQFHINLLINSRGHHEASWRHPNSTPLPLTDVRYCIDCAQKAEAAHFDSIFLADVLNIPEDIDRSALVWLEPLRTLGALAVTTSRIGLIATASAPLRSRSSWRASSPRCPCEAAVGYCAAASIGLACRRTLLRSGTVQNVAMPVAAQPAATTNEVT